MNIKINFQNLLLCLLSFDILSTILYLNDFKNPYYLSKGLNFLFMLLNINSKWLKLNLDKNFINYVFGVFVTFLISSFIQSSPKPIIFISQIIIFTFPLYFLGILLKEKSIFKLILYLQFINISLSIYGYLTNPFTFSKYLSIYFNSNTSGLVNSFIITINVLAYIKFKKYFSNQNKAIFIISSINSLLLVGTSNNRLSILLFITSLIIYFLIYLINNLKIIKNRIQLKNIYKIKPLFFLSILLIFLVIIFPEIFYSLFFEKTLYLMQREQDITNGRFIIWKEAFNYLKIFGDDSFRNFHFLQIHSNYISYFIRFGIIPSILFYLPFFYHLISQINNKSRVFSISFFLLLQMIIIWFFESKFVSITNLFLFVTLGYENKLNHSINTTSRS